MDLIYQNADRADLGVMKNYEMDLAYGKDENDFGLSIDLDEHCLKNGYILYMEGTEYGGIVDKIKASNVDDTVTYSGRTWHGVLEGKVMEPVGNNDYLLLNGNANEVLKELIEAWGLTDLFSVSEEKSSVNIVNYQVRYAKGYTGIRQMLFQFGGKLMMRYKRDRVVLSAEPYIDYSKDEEFDSSQVCFTSEKDYRPLNHLICTGLGELNEPYTIHLFCDEYGSPQGYATVDIPIKDSEYILTKENQRLFGKDEVVDVLDNGSVQAVKNYVLLNEMPKGWYVDGSIWDSHFSDVYTLDEEGKFKQAEASEQDVYEVQTVQPDDWRENYKDCYVRTGNIGDKGNYTYESAEFEEYVYGLLTSQPIDWWNNWAAYYESYTEIDDEGKEVTKYKEVENFLENLVLQKQIPNDWATNYENYYTKTTDGFNTSYPNVSGVTENYYLQQHTKPTDWETNYGSYYKKSGGKYEKQLPDYKKESKKPKNWTSTYGNYYQRTTDGTTVTYKQVGAVSKEYYEVQTSKPSDWKTNYKNYYYKSGNAYKNVEGDKAPTWKKKKYYTKKSKQVAPAYNSVKPIYGAYAPQWNKCPRYTQKSKTVAPKWKAGMYYTFAPVYAPVWKENTYYIKYPQWEAGIYYSKVERMVAPVWRRNVFYQQHLDHYAKLVEKGLEQLQKKKNGDKLDISLELEKNYDINDIVGATEHITGQSVWMPITKKIVKITDTTETVEYEVGE